VKSRESVITKVVAMLRLARAAGSEAEAHTAFALAQRLMYAHDIEERELEEAPSPAPIDDAVVDTAAGHVGWKEVLAAIVAESFRCAIILSRSRSTGAVSTVFLGRRDDVAVATEAYQAAVVVAGNLAEEHAAARPRGERDAARGSFLTGFLRGIDKRFRENAAGAALMVLADPEVMAHATALTNGGAAAEQPLETRDAEAMREGFETGFEQGGGSRRLR
jgi:hypothetical protein